MGGPTLIIVDSQGIFWGAFIGFLLSLPISLFNVYWFSAVIIRRKAVALIGAFIGSFLCFVGILAWVDELIYNTVLPGASPGSTFFGSVLACSISGLAFGIAADLIVSRVNRRDYRRPSALQE
jgi:hypothetical protein